MHSKKFVVVGLICTLLAGCAIAPVRLNTLSGRPEVTISGVTKKKIVDAVVNRELSKGWDLKSQTDSLLVFTKKDTSFGAKLLFGSKYDTVPENRLTFTMVEVEAGVRVLVKGEIITNPGSAFERVEDMTAANAKHAETFQATLEEIKTEVELTVGK